MFHPNIMKMKNLFYLSLPLLALACLAPRAAHAQFIEGKNPAGSAVTQNPVIMGGIDSSGNAVRLKLNLDGTLTATVTGAGDASAANQTAVQANAGSDASKAVGIQGITGGKAVPVTGTFWQTTQPVSGTFWQTTQPV